jgi:hypothetical protein
MEKCCSHGLSPVQKRRYEFVKGYDVGEWLLDFL